MSAHMFTQWFVNGQQSSVWLCGSARCPLWASLFWLKILAQKDIGHQQMRPLTAVAWRHDMKRCKLNTSYGCGASKANGLNAMRQNRAYTFPVTTYICRAKKRVVHTVMSAALPHSETSKPTAGSSYSMRWRAVLLSHDHLWIFLSGC